jgi:dolichyl-phosphate beta-glucosyltransferase
MYLSVVIPAYNEEQRIGKTMQTVCAYLKQQPYPAEVMVIDDGSEAPMGVSDMLYIASIQ